MFISSEQRLKVRDARIKRYRNGTDKLIELFMQQYSFSDVPEIVSLSTGVLGDNIINCHIAKENGLLEINRNLDADFQNVKLYIKHRVSPLATMINAIKIHNEFIPINL